MTSQGTQPVHLYDFKREIGEYFVTDDGTQNTKQRCVTQFPVVCSQDVVDIMLTSRYEFKIPTQRVSEVTCANCKRVIDSWQTNA